MRATRMAPRRAVSAWVCLCGAVVVLLGAAARGQSGAARALEQAYLEAVRDASRPEPAERASDLVALVDANPRLRWNEDGRRLLVVTWKSQGAHDDVFRDQTRTSAREDVVVWVTTVPEAQEMCQAYVRTNPEATDAAVNLRLTQYLGLHHTWQYDVFVEMWVSPDELFRPCVDPEVTDSQCDLDFGTGTPAVENIDDYRTFYQNLYFQNFRGKPGVPWTGLGYTYDWGNPLTEQGASEFILVPEATYQIERVVGTREYCGPRVE